MRFSFVVFATLLAACGKPAEPPPREDSLRAEYDSRRAALLADSKRLFIENKPEQVVALLQRFQPVMDSELMGIYRLSSDQVVARSTLPSETSAITLTQDEREREECEKSVRCWAGETGHLAMPACTDAIEAQWPKVATWVNEAGNPKWKNPQRGPSSSTPLTWFGNRLRYAKANGEWQRQEYWCEYDYGVVAIGVRPSNVPLP